MESTTVEVRDNIADRLGKPVMFRIGLSVFLFNGGFYEKDRYHHECVHTKQRNRVFQRNHEIRIHGFKSVEYALEILHRKIGNFFSVFKRSSLECD